MKMTVTVHCSMTVTVHCSLTVVVHCWILMDELILYVAMITASGIYRVFGVSDVDLKPNLEY